LKMDETEVLFTSIVSYQHQYFDENLEAVFDKLNQIFKNENFQYSDVLRQWNYIEDILQQDKFGDGIKQHYQIFNDYRSVNYDPFVFNQGYPVATGIGVQQGKCCIEVIAVRGNHFNVVPIHNKQQVDAYAYSERVLVGMPIEKLDRNSSPKFERAKLLELPLTNLLLISGTASIIGEETVCVDDVEGQTQTTIDNIDVLVEQAKLIMGTSCKVLNYRAYVKRPCDCQKVKEICEKKYCEAQGILLLADICRDDLLVEIECNYIFEKSLG
jgi:hypothetical protein